MSLLLDRQGFWPAHLARAGNDLADGFRSWRIWWTLGANDIRQRYRRSRLGQFWITLTMAVFVLTIGVVYSTLFSIALAEYIPHLAVNLIVWNLMTGIVGEAPDVFVSSKGYIQQENIAKTVFVLRSLVRNVLAFLHNAVLIPIVLVALGYLPAPGSILLSLLGLALFLLNGLFLSLIIGVVGTRFRDTTQIVVNLMQVAFFISPIMWRPRQIAEDMSWIVDLNPFANHLVLISEPLFGRVPDAYHYLFVVGLTLVLGTVALLIFARFRARIVYWL